MQNGESRTEDIVRRALGPTDECPAIEELESLSSGDAIATSRWSGHVQVCGFCQTELHLLQTFLAERRGEAAQNAGNAAEILATRRREIFKQAFPAPDSTPWWRSVFTVRRLAQASFAVASVLLLVGAVFFFRSTGPRPQLEARNQNAPEVLRSASFSIVSPSGDVGERPLEIRWEQVRGAASYQVRLLEVDRTEFWKASTTDRRIELPEAIRARIVPAKTLFADVKAFDSSGNQIASTELVRFRLVQSPR